MSKSIWPLLLLLLLFLIWWFVCPMCFFTDGSDEEKVTQTIEEPIKKAAAAVTALAPASLLIKDGAAFSATAPTNIDFKRSTAAYITPLSAEVNSSLEKTATYLKEHPDRSLTINGIYGEKEKYEGFLPNLGFARADNVKKKLMTLGVPGSQLLTDASLIRSGLTWKDVMYNGVKFDFSKTSNDLKERLSAIKARLDAKPITLRFATGKQEVNISTQQRQDFADLVFYLDNVDKSALEVSGHTDNKGPANVNTRLSRKRAEFIRDYLINNGLSKNRMTAKGYGPDSPIATNDTEQGRSQNRRVEVRLK